MQKAVFLDRDGVLNKNIFYPSSSAWESPRIVQEFEFLDGVIPSLKKLQDAGFLLFIVTNQPSYAKGKTTLCDLQKILSFCQNELLKIDISITKIYCSFNHPKSKIPELAVECKYRKPAAGALLEAKKEFNLDMKNSWMIGDRETDVECGKAAQVKTIFITPDYSQKKITSETADFNALNITEAVSIITNT